MVFSRPSSISAEKEEESNQGELGVRDTATEDDKNKSRAPLSGGTSASRRGQPWRSDRD